MTYKFQHFAEARSGRVCDLKYLADGVEVKADGSFAARFITWGGPDLDGDLQVRGSIVNLGATVPVSAWDHSSWEQGLPVGTAKLTDDAKGAVARGRFHDTQAGREHLEVIRAAGRAQQWSYGFKILESEKRPAGRAILRQTVFEVSPVLRAAGVDTATIEVDGDEKAAELAPELRRALREAKAYIDVRRARDRVVLETARDILERTHR